jgi:predicted permease
VSDASSVSARVVERRESIMPHSTGSAGLLIAGATVLFGIFIRRAGYVNDGDGRSVCRVIFASTLPAVMARTFSTAVMDASASATVIAGFAFGATCVATSLTTSWAMRGGRKMEEITDDELIRMSRISREALVSGSAIGLNLGNFAYPLTEILFGKLALTMMVVFDATNQIFLLVIAHAIYTYKSSLVANSTEAKGASTRHAIWESVRKSLRKQATNPCLVACVATVLYRLAYGSGGFPPRIDAMLEFLANANKPLALLALGILFEPNLQKEELRELACALCRRYGSSMLCCAGVLATMGPVLGTVGSAVVVMATLSPLPLLTVTYAMEFGLNVPFAAMIVNYANVLSAVIVAALAAFGVSYSDPVALAPKIAVAGTLMLGTGALIRRSEVRASRSCTIETTATAFAHSRANRRFASVSVESTITPSLGGLTRSVQLHSNRACVSAPRAAFRTTASSVALGHARRRICAQNVIKLRASSGASTVFV